MQRARSTTRSRALASTNVALDSLLQHPLYEPPAAPRPMSGNNVVFISGATGQYSFGINGPYDRTSETRHGYAVYGKRGDASMCIEHYGGRWQVKAVSSKGSDRCSAYVTGGCALEACTSRVWKVFDGKAYVNQSSVRIATGADAEREVSGGCMRPQQSTNHSPPSLSPPPNPL